MDKHYYLISQLPMLFFDQISFMTVESFLKEAEKWLSSRDFERLSKVDINATSLGKRGQRVWRKYQAFEFGFRSALAAWRKSLREGEEIKPDFPLSMVKEGNPLEVEKKLLRWRWDFIEEMEREHHFDLEFLILYFLKLQILHRLSQFRKEKGMEKFHKVVSDVLLRAKSEKGTSDAKDKRIEDEVQT